jgi:hypothetical protein
VHKLGRAPPECRELQRNRICASPTGNAGGLAARIWISDPLAALVARLTFVAETAGRLSSSAALVPRLTFVPELAGRLIGEGRTRGGQGEQAGE